MLLFEAEKEAVKYLNQTRRITSENEKLVQYINQYLSLIDYNV